MGARVLLGLAAPDEQAVEEALYANAELHVLASAADAGELLELAQTRRPELVLVSAGLPGLEPRTLAHLRLLGPVLAGLALDDRAAAALDALELEHVVRAPLARGALLELLSDARTLSDGEPGPLPKRPGASARAPRSGGVVAVLGTRGAPGASELAASFAVLVGRRHRTLLAELDAEGGGLALRLGVDPYERSLLGLVRALGRAEADPGALLPHWVVEDARGWPAVLPGLPDARALADAAAPGLSGRVLAVLGASFPLLVCDLGQRLRRAGERDHAARLHREVALAADALLVVLGARPAQLRAGLEQLDLLLGEFGASPEALRVVVNGQPGVRAPHDADGGGALTRALAERGLTVDAWLPWEERALRAALRRGLPLVSAARRGGYARALAGLAGTVLLPSLPRPAGRKRRLALAPAGSEQRAPAREEVALPWKR